MKLRDTCSLEKKVMTNLDSILKSRDITLTANFHLFPAMVLSVVMYGCENQTIKKAERWRIDAFELWCWRRLLKIPWTARRSNQSILKEISPEYSLEGLMLKLQYLGHLMRRTDHWKRPWCWERLKAGGEGDNREWDGCMASQIWRTWVWVSSRSWWWTRNPGMLQSMGSQIRTQLNHWTKLIVLGAQIVTNLTAMLETQVLSLHQEDPLEKDKVTYSSILA